MDSGTYWKIRALAKALEVENLKAELATQQARNALDAALTAAGLDGRIPYRFDDTKEAITPVHPANE